jgi:hypothetical protein
MSQPVARTLANALTPERNRPVRSKGSKYGVKSTPGPLCNMLEYAPPAISSRSRDALSCMCGRSRPPAPRRQSQLSEMILTGPACLVGAQNVQIRNGTALVTPEHPVDQIGGSARGYLANSSSRQRSGHGHLRHDSERARIFMQTVVSPERAHMPLVVRTVLSASGLVCAELGRQ